MITRWPLRLPQLHQRSRSDAAVLGPEHPDTLYIWHSVARWTGQAGDPASARDKYQELLSMRERILGHNHPDTQVARKLLDYWTEKADSEPEVDY
jgi:hypothetical protein